MHVTDRQGRMLYNCHLITFSIFINSVLHILKKYDAVFCNISKHYLYKIKSWPMIHNSAIDKEYNHVQQVLKINIQILETR